MTETASVAFLSSVDDDPEAAMLTAGTVLDGLEVAVVDAETVRPVPPGQSGILLLRGPSIMLRYHDQPAETAAVLSEDGWFHTGDLVRLDAEGRLTFLGRQSDHFRVGGELVDPVEIEMALQTHPAVLRAAVAGVPDERLGFVAHAWVQLHDGTASVAEHMAEELSAHVRGRLARFKIPRRIHVVGELPTTPSGKVQKFRLLAATASS
jgi:fatty-acyl-CoA synthase